MHCPVCEQALQQRAEAEGYAWGCSRCAGLAIGAAVLRRRGGTEVVAEVSALQYAGAPAGKACPSCRNTMFMGSVWDPSVLQSCGLLMGGLAATLPWMRRRTP